MHPYLLQELARQRELQLRRVSEARRLAGGTPSPPARRRIAVIHPVGLLLMRVGARLAKLETPSMPTARLSG